MIITALASVGVQNIPRVLTGQQKLESGGGLGATIGSVISIVIGLVAVAINYRRNNSLLYAFLAFIFSEIYLGFVFISFIIKKIGM